MGFLDRPGSLGLGLDLTLEVLDLLHAGLEVAHVLAGEGSVRGVQLVAELLQALDGGFEPLTCVAHVLALSRGIARRPNTCCGRIVGWVGATRW